MLEMLMAVVPRFFTVMVFAAVVLPINVLAKVILSGETWMAVPMPDRFTVSGLVTPESVTVRAPVLGPRAVGLKASSTAQELPTASEVPQVLELMTKSPVGVMLVKVMVAVWSLLMVTLRAALVPPSGSQP